MGNKRVKRDFTKCTLQEEKFINRLLQGDTQAEAYKYAYPASRVSSPSVLNDVASKLFRRERVNARYNELLAEMRERELVKTGWTREQAIETLKFVILSNKKDMERVSQAYDEEIEMLQEAISKADNAEMVTKLMLEMLRTKKKVRSSMTNNNALIGAVAELNKMQGFNEQNINMNASVIFQGEEDLQD